MSLVITNFHNFRAQGANSSQVARAKESSENLDSKKVVRELVEEDKKELELLFQKLEAFLSKVFVSNEQNNLKEIREKTLELIKEIRESQELISNTRKSLAQAGIKLDIDQNDFFKGIKFHDLESPEKTKEIIVAAQAYKKEVYEKARFNFLKNNLNKIEEIFFKSQDIKNDILALEDKQGKSFFNNKHGSLERVNDKISILEKIVQYHSKNNELKDLAEYIGDFNEMNILERMELYESLRTLKETHPDLDKVRDKVPDYNIRLNKFLEDVRSLAHINGAVDLIYQATKNFFAQNEEGKSLPFVLGAFNEARLNTVLQEKGYVVEGIGVKYVENLPFIIDENGNDLLERVDFGNPKKALLQLQKLGLIDNDSSESKMKKFQFSNVNHILYFDSETGKILSHKKNRNTSDNRIFVRQNNGSFALTEIDCISTRLKDSDVFYIEHKITPDSFINKNLGKEKSLTEFEIKNPGQQTQLEKLMIIAKAHQTKPAVMIDLAKTKYFGLKNSSTLLPIQQLIKDVETKRPDLPKLTIFDEQAQDVTNLFRLAA